jgi:hypothetical protein
MRVLLVLCVKFNDSLISKHLFKEWSLSLRVWSTGEGSKLVGAPECSTWALGGHGLGHGVVGGWRG